MDGSMDQLVTYELRDEIALIGLNRPAKRNAVSDRVVEALNLAIERAQLEAKAAVIHGEGTHFCAGLDLAEHSEKPLIAAVQGHHKGDAAAAHVRVADETAFFGLPEGTRGIFVGGGGSVRIARLIGTQRMGDMMLTGRTVSPVQMEQWGGVSYVVPAGQALERAITLAKATAQNAPMSNYAIINALPRIRDMSSEDGLFVESLMSALTSVTPEATERLRAFLEKRTAKLAAPTE